MLLRGFPYRVMIIEFAWMSRWTSAAGGVRGNRTPDLLNAIQALSQLSYDPLGAGAGL